MARTLIGQLILTLKQDFGEQAKLIDADVTAIENSIKRLTSAPWGSGFQRQLDSLKVSATERQAIVQSWADTFGALKKTDFKTALQRADFADWKNGVIGHLGAVRTELQETEKRTQLFANRIRSAMRPVVGLLGYAGGGYLGYQLGREGVVAGAKRGQERFREQMAGLRSLDMASLGASSLQLSTQYRNASETDIRQMGLRALSAMGTMDRTIDILPSLTQALVTLKSAKGDVGASQLGQLMKGIDVTGLNVAGPQGVQNVKDILEGFVRAAQIEGEDLDVGKFWQFARRAKIASSGLSPEFLATVAPAFMQDMGADTFGTGLSSAYQSFVIGSNAVASKVNLQKQHDIGLRSGEGGPMGFGNLVGSDLFSTNPYEWTKQYLVPALKKEGVDMSSDVAVEQAIAQLSRNTTATSLLTRMVLQQPQVDKSIGLYNQTMGLSAADQASAKDPFAAWGGLTSSLDNLAGAVSEKVDIIVPGLNRLSDAINGMAKFVETNPGWATGAAAAGVGVAGFAAYKGVKTMADWLGAGTQLQIAATELQAAAAALQTAAGAEGVGGAGGAVGNAEKTGVGLLGWIKGFAVVGAPGLAAGAFDDHQTTWEGMKAKADQDYQAGQPIRDALNSAYQWAQGAITSNWLTQQFHAPGPPSQDPVSKAVGKAAGDTWNWFTGGQNLAWGSGDPRIPRPSDMLMNRSGSPDDRDHGLGAVTTKANTAKAALEDVNATVVAPKVDTSSIDAAAAKAAFLHQSLLGINTWRPGFGTATGNNIRDQLDRSFADHGIAP